MRNRLCRAVTFDCLGGNLQPRTGSASREMVCLRFHGRLVHPVRLFWPVLRLRYPAATPLLTCCHVLEGSEHVALLQQTGSGA